MAESAESEASPFPEGSKLDVLLGKQKYHQKHILRLLGEINDLMVQMRELNLKTSTAAGSSQQTVPKVSDKDFGTALYIFDRVQFKHSVMGHHMHEIDLVTMRVRPFSQ